MKATPLIILAMAACTGPADTSDTGHTAVTDDFVDTQLWLGVCDAWDAPSLEGGLADLEPLEGSLAMLADAGLGLARPHRPGGHVFAMSAVSREGGWDWSEPDYVVQRSTAAGVRLMVTLQPDVIRTVGAEVAPFSVAPDQLDAWAEYVRRMVERYDGDGDADMPGLVRPVVAWEIGNEPVCEVDDNGCMEAYLDTVRAAYEAAHEADPEATVALGGALPVFLDGTGEVDPRATAVYEYFFDSNGHRWTDAMSFHVITGRIAPPATWYLAAWEDVIPAGIPIWLTESGPYDAESTTVPGEPEEVAAWYVEQLEAVREAGVERAMWCMVKHGPDERPAVLEALAEYTATLD